MKNSFVVNYAVHLWIAALGVGGFPATLIAFFATKILGSMLDHGLIELDIQIDKIKEALKDEHWREAAQKAYSKASSGVYTEEEKNEIRNQYLKALSDYAKFGNADGVPSHDKNP